MLCLVLVNAINEERYDIDNENVTMFSQVTFASHEAALALTLSEKAGSYYMLACVVVF
jgi:hypothetical protein